MDSGRGEHKAMGDHFGKDLRATKEMNNSRYSISSVGLFLCGWLCPTTKRQLTRDESHAYNLVVGFRASEFNLLNEEHALSFALPHILAFVGQCS